KTDTSRIDRPRDNPHATIPCVFPLQMAVTKGERSERRETQSARIPGEADRRSGDPGQLDRSTNRRRSHLASKTE
ncbi:hypothetical protein, partial [Thioalkalivibrio sp.]|uniref:hypothetical protein n=1 Tax=Thioalkalivibrio sp. TaxID=2093813 RepID=UPI0039767E75